MRLCLRAWHGFANVRCRTATAVAAATWVLVAASNGLGSGNELPKIMPSNLGLPSGNVRSSEPFVTRVYRTDSADKIVAPQPNGYPKTIDAEYTLQEHETARTHYGVDLTSRDEGGKPAPLDFRAGVFGKVLKAGDGPWGTITVQVQDGSILQFLHTSKSYVKVNDAVTPDTLLGKTGSKGAGAIHLHIQARDKFGNFIAPDLVFDSGKKRGTTDATIAKDDLEFNPDDNYGISPTALDGKVSKTIKPRSRWFSEVIGEGGKVDLLLGEFYDYQSASYCSVKWSVGHPDDLRLTREREEPVESSQLP
jgi:hypothetical protein